MTNPCARRTTATSPHPAPGWKSAALAGLLVLAAATGGSAQPGGGESAPPETFTAATANMDPEGTELRFNVLRWSDDDERAAVLDVLTSADTEAGANDDLDALLALPTMGYVWPDGSSLGYAIKYARREAAPDGGERLTFVTGRRLGRYGRAAWAPAGAPDAALRPFTVIELRLDSSGDGAGTMSPAADIAFDTTGNTVALADYDAATTLLAGAKRQPAPYWAR